MRSSTRSFLACVAVLTIIGVKAPLAMAQPEGTIAQQPTARHKSALRKGVEFFTTRAGALTLITAANLMAILTGSEAIKDGEITKAAILYGTTAGLSTTSWYLSKAMVRDAYQRNRERFKRGVNKLEGTRFGGPLVRSSRKIGGRIGAFSSRQFHKMKQWRPKMPRFQRIAHR